MSETVAIRGQEGARLARPPPLSLRQAFWVWLRVSALSFGGPAGQIAMMHRMLVQERRWIGEERFLHALNYCMLLPGPEAQQLATYIGWLMHRTRGGIVAGGLFILPGMVSVMALSWVYALYGRVGIVSALFFGLKAAVLAIVLQAVMRIGKRALKGKAFLAMAVAAFVLLFVFDVPFPIVILGAALIGYGGGRLGLLPPQAGEGHSAGEIAVAEADTLLGDELPAHARPSGGKLVRTALVWLLLWLSPVALLLLWRGPSDVFSQIATLFSTLAAVTFGGAYAVLAYVAQEAVGSYHWLRPGEMLDGLGMAETTPGPLIMVLQFVGFMGAYRHPGGLAPLLAGTLGGLLATWVTFIPCFLWIFVGAPFIERLRGNEALAGALAAITAAVVGVIVNLGLWFAIHAIFRTVRPFRFGPVTMDLPLPASVNLWALLLSAAAILAIFRLKVSMLPTLAGTSAAGIALYLAGAIA
jgi:chromate transporter